ncbi:hypothetical protein WJX74_004371 [Apatococcus lobatus]|uniref:Uncharacterized protein n=1 Tax=Apatococcus lobatus TaxID=904363 RepID=A0AAW1QIH6_9CHLO
MSAHKSWRRLVRYVQQDLREIFVPTSLPDPPEYKEPRKLSWRERFEVVQAATQDYAASWQKAEPEAPERQEPQAPIKEELAAVARGGAKTIQPYLQQLYQTRASAYRDAVQEFVKGYREGIDANEQEEQQQQQQQQVQSPASQLQHPHVESADQSTR